MLAEDPTGWRLLVGCVLLNVTTRTAVDQVRGELFRRWPNAAKVVSAREATIAGVLAPLGCSSRRANTLRRMSAEFWELVHERFERGARVTADDIPGIYGLGEYARDSWAIFVEGRLDLEPTDRVLAAYLVGYRRGVEASAAGVSILGGA